MLPSRRAVGRTCVIHGFIHGVASRQCALWDYRNAQNPKTKSENVKTRK